MKNIREAAAIVREWDLKEQRAKLTGKGLKWTEVYSCEKEILEDLKKVEVPSFGKAPYIGVTPLYKGYEFIHSFAKTVQGGGSLTPKQMTQAKRLAVQIKKAALIAG